MQLPFTLPDWAPPWANFVIVSVAVLFLLAFLLMPFSVFGLKGRMDGIEARLDDIQNDIRSLAMRLPDSRRVEYDAEVDLPPASRSMWRQTSQATSQETSPAMSQTPSPAMSQTPSPATSQTPSPAMSQTPSPAMSQTPSPAMSQTPSPAISQTPSPAMSPPRPAPVDSPPPPPNRRVTPSRAIRSEPRLGPN